MNIAITGANRGIGLALTEQYSNAGEKVYALCRQSSKELEQLNNVTIITNIDVTDQHLKPKLQEKIDSKTIDLFINNAGIATWDTFEDFEFEKIRQQFEVNTLGPLNMMRQMNPFLAPKAKVGIITSRMGSISDNTSGGYYGYRISKAAANAMGRSLAHDIKKEGHPVAILHPGFVKTDMTNHNGDISTKDSAAGLMAVMSKLSIENTGRFWHTNGEELPW